MRVCDYRLPGRSHDKVVLVAPKILGREIYHVRLSDGSVNGVGGVVSGWSALLRRLQTGSVRGYAASLLAGVVLILGYYLWR